MDIQRNSGKLSILRYFKNRSLEILRDARQQYSENEYKKRANFINREIIKTRKNLTDALIVKAQTENWSGQEILEIILMITYCSYVSMLETRHRVWAYEYMTFARRIGELWEQFMLNCWDFCSSDIQIFTPPRFTDIKDQLTDKITNYIKNLNISNSEQSELLSYYNKVWSFVTSGEIKLGLDLHFIKNGVKYVVDFKSGFSSNEKGNTNRLLLVASVYDSLGDNYRNLMFVRSPEDKNNHYLQILINSGLWEVYCADSSLTQIHKFTNFDIKSWMDEKIDWSRDLNNDFYQFIVSKNLTEYLKW